MRIVPERRREIHRVIRTEKTMVSSRRKAAVSEDCQPSPAAKKMVISAIRVGKGQPGSGQLWGVKGEVELFAVPEAAPEQQPDEAALLREG